MNTISPLSDSVCLYSILKHHQDTLDLVRMRAVCRKWREIVDHISRNTLEFSLGVRVDYVDEATVRIFQITMCFNKIICPDSTAHRISEIRTLIPKLERVTQLKLIKQVFETNIEEYKSFLTSISPLLPQQVGTPTFIAILVKQCNNLAVAAQFNSQEGFLYILNHNSYTKEERIQECQKALLPACLVGNYTLIWTIIDQEADPTKQEIQMDTRETYLTAACKSNCYQGVKLLLETGADFESRNSMGEKPIAIAARVNEYMFDLLKEKVKDPHEKFGPANDKTLAHFAAEGNKPKVIDWMISKEVNIDEQNNRGLTPLMIAIREESIGTFRNLVACRASLEKTCGEGLTPLDYAVMRRNNYFIETLIERNPKTSILLKALKTAISVKNTFAINQILGLSTPITYGAAIIGGGVLGGLLVWNYFQSGNSE